LWSTALGEKFVSALVLPSGIVYTLAILGLLAAAWHRSRRFSPWLLGGSAAVLLVFSSGMVASALMSPLEYAFPSVHSAAQFPQVRNIVVLTGYAADDPDMPLTGRLHYTSAQRVTMTLQMARSCANCRVIVSGAPETAKVMGEVLVELGLPRANLVLEDRSATTADSAANLVALLRDEECFLVTSAGHMLRARGVMTKAGLRTVPVPTDHQGPRRWWQGSFSPSPESLTVSDLAVHEYVGRLWYHLRGLT
jgi:uncharacterized SAM-binding protein YcdF (DUF218 family)